MGKILHLLFEPLRNLVKEKIPGEREIHRVTARGKRAGLNLGVNQRVPMVGADEHAVVRHERTHLGDDGVADIAPSFRDHVDVVRPHPDDRTGQRG